MIIVLEGIDNCGKNTIANQLLNIYPSIRREDFPDYTSPFGKFIKEVLFDNKMPPISLQLLFSAERLSRCESLKSRNTNSIILTTRYTYSSLAYGSARGINRELLNLLEVDMPIPDIKIYLSITPEESVKRAKKPDIIENDFQLLKAVKNEYYKIITTEKNWFIIDAMQPINDVIENIKKIIDRKIKEFLNGK